MQGGKIDRTVICPDCGQSWFLVSRHDDRHVKCNDCYHEYMKIKQKEYRIRHGLISGRKPRSNNKICDLIWEACK